MKLIGALIFLTLAVSANASDQYFVVEPTNRATVFGVDQFSADDKLIFAVEGLAQGDTFYLQRCGSGCNSAKVALSISGPKKDVVRREYIVQEAGQYYFWVRHINEAEESGPLSAGETVEDGGGLTITFGENVSVKASVEPSNHSLQARRP